jgi:Ser/Thr protein kinase RdoA (MazF antagonist)
MSAKGLLLGRGRLAEVFEWGDGQVLKLFASDRSKSAVDEEARIGRLVHEAGVPTPATGEVVELEGRLGIVYERVHGASMLSLMPKQPWRLVRYAHALAALQASVHEHSVDGLVSQRDTIRASILRAKVDEPLREAAHDRLSQLPEGRSLCHGDFHPDNVLMASAGPVVIDWTNACTGNRIGDFANAALILQLGDLPPHAPVLTRALVRCGRALFHRSFLSRYLRLTRTNLRELEAWTLPLVVARLGRDIDSEREQLLALARSADVRPPGGLPLATQPLS